MTSSNQIRAVAPEIPGADVVMCAEDQHEYQTVPIVPIINPNYPHSNEGFNAVVLAYRPNKEQRQRLASGEDIYIQLLTFGQSMQPISVMVGNDCFIP
jgi:hypothetical protein